MNPLPSKTLAFAAVTVEEVPVVQDLARRIWHSHYPGIITSAQIDYMLGRYFSDSTLRHELNAGGIWELAKAGPEPVGFLACQLEPAERRLKLSKLYLAPEFHGVGLGQQMLNRVRTLAETQPVDEVYLTVNKRNAKALRAYERFGFRRTGEIVADIGEGFVMDDYRLAFDCRRPGATLGSGGA